MAGRPRLPDAIIKATGANAKNPQRFRDRKPPKSPPLGAPPAKFSDAEKAVWAELLDEMPWLTKSDRRIVAIACRLQVALDDDPVGFPIGGYAQLRMCLSLMGGTPSDKTKVSAPSDDETDDPADEFIN